MTSEFPFERIEVRGGDALSTWERLRGDGGGWPVVIGAEEDFERVAEGLEFLANEPGWTQAELAAAASYRFPDDYREQRADERRRLEAEHPEWFADGEMDASAPRGVWPTVAPEETGLYLDRDVLSRRFHDAVSIIRLPTRDWTEAPAHLGWGGWNECPAPRIHVAAFRSWRERYGVELAGLSGDVVILRAARLPATREEALALAQEQYDYCADIVDQGCETLDALAATLKTHRWWFFWWD